MLIRPLRQIADRFNNIQRGLVGAERVLGIMDEENSMPNLGTTKKRPYRRKNRIPKCAIFLMTKKQEVLKGVDFKVKSRRNSSDSWSDWCWEIYHYSVDYKIL